MKYYNKKNKKDEGWKVKNNRPEEILESAEEYYNEEEIENYSKSGGMKRAQQEIALETLDLIEINKKDKILDVGCGVGYTMEVFSSLKYKIEGIDLMQGMVDKAEEKGFRVKQGDMKNLNNVIKKESYDIIISISALQWIKNKEDLFNVAKSFFYILKKQGKAIIQFYPKSKKEFLQVAEIFKKSNFYVEEIIKNENNPRKRKVFLILKK